MASTVDTKRRVKHYVLNDARQWVDRGTGHVSWIYNDKQRSVSLIVKSENDGNFLNNFSTSICRLSTCLNAKEATWSGLVLITSLNASFLSDDLYTQKLYDLNYFNFSFYQILNILYHD